MKNNRIKIILIVASLIFLWNISAWFIADDYYKRRVKEVIEQKTELSRERAGDVADSINRNLNYLHGIPDLLSQLLRVKDATSRFGKDITHSTLPIDERKKRWTKDPRLNNLSQYLALAKVSLNVDIIFVINAAGDCVAASNWNTKESTIGTNFMDRDYFQSNKNGQRGMQYAVGKTTNIPGLYFSTPVITDGHFMGAVVTKTDVPNLSFLIQEMDAFVTDENGVVVLARDKQYEMLSVTGASVAEMPEQKRFARYKRVNFPVFHIGSWGDNKFPSLMRFQDENIPHVYASTDIPQYRMKAFVADHIVEYSSLSQDAGWFAFLLGMSGSVLILMLGGAILYVSSIKAAGVALERANRAERRIITISEDTQQRIGRELHDDLGQLLTGVAFMSEVLFKKLAGQGHTAAKEASRITTLINEAISKTRNLAQGLYPVELKEAGLTAMLKNLAKNTEEIYRIKCEFICEGECVIDDSLAVINLFRIAQEAVNNAIKHGNPANITLKLVSVPTAITLEVNDDGSGIKEPEGSSTKEGLGLRSMRYRASLLGGTMHIIALPSGGTRLTVRLPA